MNITEVLLDYIFDKSSQPKSAVNILHLSLLDWAAVSLSGKNEPVAKIVRSYCVEESGNPEAFIFGSNERLPARAAALVNGTISHALDYDDTHFDTLGHPSVAVLPAALALADRTNCDMKSFQYAALLGMEIATRIGVWLGREHYRKGFHITATAGTFGATVAAGNLLKLNRAQMLMGLGLASSRAAGIKAQFGTMGKPFHAGIAASNGVEVAILASKGFTATKDGFEGPQGFANTHSSERNQNAFINLGKDFLFERVSHKFHACCHATHAALEALIKLRDDYNISPEDIEEIKIITHPQYLNVCNILSPQTGLEAKFSYKLTAAMVMYRIDTAKLETFSNDLCSDPNLVGMRDKVFVKTDSALSETGAKVAIKISGRGILKAKYDLTELKDFKEREAKVYRKAESLLGPIQTKKLWSEINLSKSTGHGSVSQILFSKQ